MNLYWSSQRAIANSKIVKSSVIWLVVVPFVAKLLIGVEEVLSFSMFEESISINTKLPFTWQLLFIAAVFFTLAGIIYSIYCPEIVKQYNSYTQFEGDGKSRMQIMHALKKIAYDRSVGKPKKEYLPHLTTYFQTYSDNKEITQEDVSCGARKLFDDITSNVGKNSNAFYYVYDIADRHTQKLIGLSFMLYSFGFVAIGIIGIENLVYVVRSMG